MDWVSDAISAFGQSVGVQGLALDSDGFALFRLEPSGMLCLHDLLPAGGSDVLLMVARPLPSPPAASMRRALQMANFRVNPQRQLQVALRGEDLVVTLRIPRHSVIPSALEEAVEALFEFHARVTDVH
jgi:type III secretion system chaperone SycN